MSKSAFSAFLEKQMGINKYTNLVINIGKFLQKLFDNFARKKTRQLTAVVHLKLN